MITILISGNNGSIVLAIVGNWLEIVGGGLKREVIDPGWSGEFKKKKYYGKRENVYFVVLTLNLAQHLTTLVTLSTSESNDGIYSLGRWRSSGYLVFPPTGRLFQFTWLVAVEQLKGCIIVSERVDGMDGWIGYSRSWPSVMKLAEFNRLDLMQMQIVQIVQCQDTAHSRLMPGLHYNGSNYNQQPLTHSSGNIHISCDAFKNSLGQAGRSAHPKGDLVVVICSLLTAGSG
ncbi:hypothetical protein T4D_16668 [Trichinella pseudospiralis]|uniref:Uncharacterized protein n=1 Tax=Trichinella pseudospiralis TaxID=6337 RepID=A0A0V1FJ77_TRIPS|nr:hypothetical protein T4D_16668 [Trichinella pseudospiralis]